MYSIRWTNKTCTKICRQANSFVLMLHNENALKQIIHNHLTISDYVEVLSFNYQRQDEVMLMGF